MKSKGKSPRKLNSEVFKYKFKNNYMRFFDEVGEGWRVFKDSIAFIFKKPIFLVPIVFSWIVVSCVILYNRYYFPDLGTFWLIIPYIYFLIVIMAFTISMANVVMLELIQQIESGEKTSLSKALGEALRYDMLKVIPIALIWGLVWLIIVLLRALTSKARNSNAEPSVQDAAMTLSGMNTPFSFGRLGLNMLEKLVRMVVFMALPAVAWEHKGPFAAYKKSFQIIKKHPTQFLTSYSLTFAAGLVMALPLISIYILSEMHVVLPTNVWVAVLIYSCIIWTLQIYLEQMTTGMLYLWHLKWVKNGSKGKLSSVKRPDLFDEIYEFK